MGYVNIKCSSAIKQCGGLYLGCGFSSPNTTLFPKVEYLLRTSKTIIQKLSSNTKLTQKGKNKIKD